MWLKCDGAGLRLFRMLMGKSSKELYLCTSISSPPLGKNPQAPQHPEQPGFRTREPEMGFRRRLGYRATPRGKP